MEPTLTQQATTPAATPVATPVTPQETPTNDILKRVAQTTTIVSEAPKVTVTMDDIKDPTARQILEKRLAEANASISKTFGEVGADKAKLLKQVEELQGKINQSWTPQRLQQELSRQDFVQAAQSLQAQSAPQGWEGSQAEWSSLTPGEKQQFQNIVASQQTLTQQMNHMLQSQVDEKLKTQYPDYDPSQVDNFYRESYAGQVPPDRIREMIYKAMNYDTHVKRAYEFAMTDKTTLNQERVNGMAPNATQATISSAAPEKKEGESNQSWMSRVVKNNLQKIAAQRASQRQ